MRGSTAEEILKRNIRDANKTALIILILLNAFTVFNYIYYIFISMNVAEMVNVGTAIAGSNFCLRAAVCGLIWKYNAQDTSWLKYIIIVAMLISAIMASFSYFMMFWAAYFVIIGFSVRYCSLKFTAGVGICSILLAAGQNLLMIPYGLKAGYLNMNLLALSKDATVTIKGGYMGVYNAVMGSGLVNLDMAYAEAVSESVMPLTAMFGFTVLCSYMAKYNKETIDVEISAAERLAEAKAEQLKKEHAYSHKLEEALAENEAHLEEISALNVQLQEDQTHLEEAAEEQEHQIEEITSLNEQLQDNQTRLEESFAENEAQLEEITAAKEELEATQEALKEALEAAEVANASKTTFLNNMSHDIRTPMNAILGFAKLMERDIDDPKAMSEHLKKISYSGEYLLTIINDILDMARIESGKTTLDEAIVDLEADQGSIAAIFEASAKRKNINLTHSWDIQHKYVYIDHVKAEQIAMNLVSNAIKYTPSGGSVDIHVKEVSCGRAGYTTICMTVADTGIGMSEEFQQHLFEAFSRERNTTLSKVIGTGLGMAIVKKLVDLMGGTITVDSELGKGSTFTVTVTVKIAETPEDYIHHQAEAVTVDFKGKRILLAEDNELNAEIAMAILSDEDFIIDHAEDGIVCLDMLNKAEPGYYDLILMDIQMPNLNGYMATQKIRKLADKAKANIPIIAMTANAFDEDKKQALEAGMNGFCTKPIDVEQLNKELNRVLK